jgi:LacI family transcriptional regulator
MLTLKKFQTSNGVKMGNQSNGGVTIKTIAKELGISFSTVSKALNNDPLIKDETRSLVQMQAAKMGYSPNAIAKSLRNNETKNIALILNDVENPSLANIFGTITKEMGTHGYSTLICDSQYNFDIESHNIATVLSYKSDAVIISPVSTKSSKLRLLKNMIENVIVLGDTIDGFNSNYVHVDYFYGGYLSAREMLANGHSKNIVISEPSFGSIGKQFIAGIKKAYTEFGLPLNEDLIFYCQPSIDNGFQQLLSLYDQDKKCFTSDFTGVITFCDSLAFGIYKAVAHLNIHIPEDLSIIGFDDYSVSSFTMPPLTTIYLPKERIASRCVEILRSKLIEKTSGTKVFTLEPNLIKRKSIKNILRI